MSDKTYCYPPDFTVLRNKLDLRNPAELDHVERLHVRKRLSQGCPDGKFDLPHLKSIHGHLFQDVYEWAGQVRTVSIAKGGAVFQPVKFIETGMADIHKRLVDRNFLKKLPQSEFCHEAGKIIGDVNYVHPFREGNGRTQAMYLQKLGAQAGYQVDLKDLTRESWIEASIQAHNGMYDKFSAEISRVTSPIQQEKASDQSNTRYQHLLDKIENERGEEYDVQEQGQNQGDDGQER